MGSDRRTGESTAAARRARRPGSAGTPAAESGRRHHGRDAQGQGHRHCRIPPGDPPQRVAVPVFGGAVSGRRSARSPGRRSWRHRRRSARTGTAGWSGRHRRARRRTGTGRRTGTRRTRPRWSRTGNRSRAWRRSGRFSRAARRGLAGPPRYDSRDDGKGEINFVVIRRVAAPARTHRRARRRRTPGLSSNSRTAGFRARTASNRRPRSRGSS